MCVLPMYCVSMCGYASLCVCVSVCMSVYVCMCFSVSGGMLCVHPLYVGSCEYCR